MFICALTFGGVVTCCMQPVAAVGNAHPAVRLEDVICSIAAMESVWGLVSTKLQAEVGTIAHHIIIYIYYIIDLLSQ
jgi:hypothetical protein